MECVAPPAQHGGPAAAYMDVSNDHRRGEGRECPP